MTSAKNGKNMKFLQRGKAKQGGFTIVELIVVILLLGILTATALPRFLDVTDEANDAVVQAVFGGLNTGVTLFRAAYVAQGEPAANTAISAFGDGTVRANAAGFPMGTTSDTDGVIDEVADCVEVFNGLLQGGRPAIIADTNTITAAVDADDITGGTTDFLALNTSLATGDAHRVCHYAYTAQYASHTAAAAASDTVPIIQYDSVSGLVTLTNSGAL